MSCLDTLIVNHLCELSGAEFKVAVYCYRLLESQSNITTTISSLAQITGLSWRQTQSALRSLAKKAILNIDSRHRGTRCSLPPAFAHGEIRPAPSREFLLAALPKKSDAATPPSRPIQSSPPITTPPAQKPLPQDLTEAQIQQLGRTLRNSRVDMTPSEFSALLAAADGNPDRLLARLRQLTKEEQNYDSFPLFCSVVRGMYLIR